MTEDHPKKHHHHHHRPDQIERWRENLDQSAHPLPTGPTADSYRIVGYANGLVGASPACDVLKPHWDSGLKWPDPNNPKPDDFLWGAGVAGGVPWDGTFYRDLLRYPAGGQFFWAGYFKPGSGPGSKNGYWFNFGSGWSHLANDDPAQIRTGASQHIAFEASSQTWKLVIEATMFVTYAVVEVWSGVKASGNDPVGEYTRVAGCDPLAMLLVEPA